MKEAGAPVRVVIPLQVDELEHRELAARAERERISVSDYIRVRLGMRGLGPDADDAAPQGD